jgi:hypothetical protein
LQETFSTHYRYDVVRKTLLRREIFGTTAFGNILPALAVPQYLAPTSENDGLHLVLQSVGSSKIYRANISRNKSAEKFLKESLTIIDILKKFSGHLSFAVFTLTRKIDEAEKFSY